MAEATPPGRSGRPLFEQLLEVGVYLPLGAAVRLAERVPDLVSDGRAVAGQQVSNARLIGRFAVGTARREFERRFLRHEDPSGDAPEGPAASPPPARSSTSNRAAREPAPSRRAAPPAASTLAIPGYDALAASQVVPLLAGLTDAELAAVRLYEESGRARRTILGRISQLEEERRARRP
ncbi:MAG: hypothetical protein JWM85_33 [Acidimicrobiaceae bacterium]|nr:hypothetical protein [Acidimicrobiaceae bacterium]